MLPRKRLLITVIGALIAGGIAAGIVVASSGSGTGDPSASASGANFTPGKIAGKWTGSWRNLRFNSTGSIRANVQVRSGNRLVPLVDFGGFVFGCQNPGPAVVTLRRGSGKNTWNANGFRVSKFTQAFGRLNITYDFDTKEFKGSGGRPPCRESITFTINGRLTNSQFNATVINNLGGGQRATSRLSASKR
jgi:hypothetical protein